MKRVMAVRHVPHEALGNLETVLLRCGVALDVVDCFAPDWPEVERRGFDPASLAGLIVMGGPMNADETDHYPFLATEIRWLAAAAQAGLPTLGVCLGAQLLAKALGARVYRNRVPEIGWHELELLLAAQHDPLFAGSAHRETVFQWHGDTFDLPPSAVHLARSENCGQQAFRFGSCAYGVQFHPEITAEMVHEWLAEPEMCAQASAVPGLDPEAIRTRADAGVAAMRPLAERVFSRFAALCLRRMGA